MASLEPITDFTADFYGTNGAKIFSDSAKVLQVKNLEFGTIYDVFSSQVKIEMSDCGCEKRTKFIRYTLDISRDADIYHLVPRERQFTLLLQCIKHGGELYRPMEGILEYLTGLKKCPQTHFPYSILKDFFFKIRSSRDEGHLEKNMRDIERTILSTPRACHRIFHCIALQYYVNWMKQNRYQKSSLTEICLACGINAKDLDFALFIMRYNRLLEIRHDMNFLYKIFEHVSACMSLNSDEALYWANGKILVY